MLPELLANLRAAGLDGALTGGGGSVRVVLKQGTAEIWHEPYGYEYYGEYRSHSSERIELVDLARQSGLRTQFMYHDLQTEKAVLGQLQSVLVWARENGF